MHYLEEFEDTKGVIRTRKSKDRQRNCQKNHLNESTKRTTIPSLVTINTKKEQPKYSDDKPGPGFGQAHNIVMVNQVLALDRHKI
jgi:hypothetical protein